MRSISIKRKVVQVFSMALLMGVMAWLATGWQETQPLQLSEQDHELHTKPWPEAHLIVPVSVHHENWVSGDSSYQINTHSM